MKLNAPPSEIYLQYYGDGQADNNPVSCEEVSWWHEMVFESDIKYTIANDQADCVSMPKSLTAENGAKALLMGEFHEAVTLRCDDCDGEGWLDEESGEECCSCGGVGNYMIKVPVRWTTIKEIYAMAVQHLAK